MKFFATLLIACCFFGVSLHAQEASDQRLKEIADKAAKDKLGWTIGGGLGFDLSGMGIINPRVGSGGGRLGIGGLSTFFANRKEANWFWNNSFSLQLSAQRLGKTSPTQPSGFQKSLDAMQLNTRYGIKLSQSKWFIAFDATARTSLLTSYASNYLKPINDQDAVASKFLSPLQVTVSPGIEFKPDEHLSFFYSPCGLQYIYVSDATIAARNVFGNEAGKNYRLSIGSEFKAGYTNKYFNNRLAVSSNLRLFSDYLKEPQNIKVAFGNTFSIAIFKGLSLDLVGEYLYDHNVLVIKDVNGDHIYNVQFKADGTIDPAKSDDRLGHGGQLTGAFFLKYNHIF